jgi:glucose/arabinose dehydrogenase
MMDETHVVPKGSHFGWPESHDGTHYNLTWQHRCTVAPVDYYYIDLGLSSW